MRQRFSERIGNKAPKSEIQMDSMDMDLKNGLWNVITAFITKPMKEDTQAMWNSSFKTLVNDIWFLFFKEPTDEIPFYCADVIKELRKRFFAWGAMDVYDFIDFISAHDEVPYNQEDFIEVCDFILKRELSGYRFVSGYLAPITSEIEIKEVEKAIEKTKMNAMNGASIHLQEALNKLADKHNPDYRNSIKESISAIESICQQITGDTKAELGKAIKKLESMMPIHGALKQSILSLYGYTSDADGIRHALMDESNLDQEDALYMLITCSSFANYLIVKANKLGIL